MRRCFLADLRGLEGLRESRECTYSAAATNWPRRDGEMGLQGPLMRFELSVLLLWLFNNDRSLSRSHGCQRS